MNEEYDAIVLGTGFKECILSGLLSVEGLRVLHMDRNNYYGAESASLGLAQMYEKFKGGAAPPATLGASRDYNVDLIPKFIMASGILTKMLVKTNVTKYVDFKQIDGSYVQIANAVQKVPATDTEALKSSLMGLFEKRRCKKFFVYIQDYDEKNNKTWEGMDLKKTAMEAVFKYFGLEADTIDFIGHALALHRNDDYLKQAAWPTVEKIRQYVESLARYGKSPYIYPLYGLGELPQAFARLSAIYGGTYMLAKPIDEIIYEGGKAVGVKSEGETARCKFIVGDPSYFKEKVKRIGATVRVICVLGAPPPNTNNSDSCQIIIPQKQLGRKSDIYIAVVSSSHNVAAAGKFIAIVSTTVETEQPEKECEPGVKLLGTVLEKFVSVSDVYQPIADGKEDHCYISSSYDATSHFETACDDVIDIYRRITGKELDLTPKPADAGASSSTTA